MSDSNLKAQLAERDAECAALRAELKSERDSIREFSRQLNESSAEVERLRAVIMIQEEPDSCARCDKTMDGCDAATGDICHDCWQSLETHARNAHKLVAAVEAKQAAESSLAAANALLEEARDAIDEACWPVWWNNWRAYLAAQTAKCACGQQREPGKHGQSMCEIAEDEPHKCDWFGRFTCRICGKHREDDEPTAPARPHCDDHAGWRSDCDRCAMYEPPPAPARTEAEQAVLDAVKRAADVWQQGGPFNEGETIEAELARRGLNNKKDNNDV